MFVLSNIAALAEIPPLVASLATTEGWGVDNTDPTRPILTRPGGGLPISVFGQDNGGNGFGSLDLESSADPGNLARANNIRLNGTVTSPETPLPTRLFLFSGTEDGNAFIAGVIEFGFNRFRMFYIGNMVRKGNYTGGEVIAANNHEPETTDFSFPVTTSDNKFLFKGTQSYLNENRVGWVHVVHPDSPTDFKPFRATISSSNSDEVDNIDIGSVIGGNFDNINDTLLTFGQQHFAAAVLINPVNLYEGFGSPRFLRPLGHPAGARSVNITNLEPTQQITVGAINWRVFPEFRKSPSTSVGQGPNSNSYPADETSVFAGMAFPENLNT